MKKIAIVGVDGSGKTVLMTALGDKYENPDCFGLFLSPENSDAFGYVKLQMDRMRHGMWPSSTIAGKSSVLEWGLFRKSNRTNTRLCDLSFLDFSGEVYRMAFGSKSDHDAALYDDPEIEESINELRQHIKDADTLAVLINLKDIISGNVGNPRTREAMWLSKSILDYATRELKTPNIAMVFTQADAYRATIAGCGGVRGAYERYLPHVANIYPDMKLVAVSAVNMTFPDENGIPCPVEGFQSEGLDDLMEWIVSTVPGCETMLSNLKDAPGRCRQEVWALRDDYIAALSCDASHRREILDSLERKLVEMGSAMRAYPQGLPQGALDLLREELHDIRNFEITYEQLRGEVSSKTDAQILQNVEELCRGSSFAGKVRQNVKDALFAAREAAFAMVARKRRKARWAVGALIFVLGAIAVGTHFVQAEIERERIAELMRQEEERQREERALDKEEEASKSKIARGWSYEMRKGHKIAVWRPGAYHSQTTNLKADYDEDKWISTKPGYVWVGGTKIEWRKGLTSRQYPHWVTVAKEGSWIHEDGYKDANPKGTYVGDKGAVWDSSWVSSDGNKRATSQEGVFEELCTCQRCDGKGTFTSDEWCSVCKGKCMKRDVETVFCRHCEFGDRDKNCPWCHGEGCYNEYGEWYQWCKQCDHGKEIKSCGNCNGTGKVWRRM